MIILAAATGDLPFFFFHNGPLIFIGHNVDHRYDACPQTASGSDGRKAQLEEGNSCDTERKGVR